MDAARTRAVLVAVAVVVAGGVGLGGARVSTSTGRDITPWTTTHGHGVNAAVVAADDAAFQRPVPTTRMDVSFPVLR